MPACCHLAFVQRQYHIVCGEVASSGLILLNPAVVEHRLIRISGASIQKVMNGKSTRHIFMVELSHSRRRHVVNILK